MPFFQIIPQFQCILFTQAECSRELNYGLVLKIIHVINHLSNKAFKTPCMSWNMKFQLSRRPWTRNFQLSINVEYPMTLGVHSTHGARQGLPYTLHFYRVVSFNLRHRKKKTT
uniref:Uncharacterized protein n=1 Tax=Cacopsylla melanoneura TaxID=428564 RepID=A0A8D8LQR6_9HEMI